MLGYIIFHPDRAREWIKVDADIIKSSSGEVESWSGTVYVDKVGKGNEDPWCITQPWLYSYCHATQLRRKEMKSGDILFFISGQKADKGILSCDTVFVVDEKLPWGGHKNGQKWIPSGLPTKLDKHRKNRSSEWKRHLRYGLPPVLSHKGEYTFSAKAYAHGERMYSNETWRDHGFSAFHTSGFGWSKGAAQPETHGNQSEQIRSRPRGLSPSNE